MDIRSFIHLEDERIVDLEEDITDQIIAHYSLQDNQEVSVKEVEPSYGRSYGSYRLKRLTQRSSQIWLVG